MKKNKHQVSLLNFRFLVLLFVMANLSWSCSNPAEPSGQEETLTYTHTYQTVAGEWCLFSFPFSAMVSVDSLFPDCYAMWTFDMHIWASPDSLVSGDGFWIKTTVADTQNFTAFELTEFTYDYHQPGWRMVGSLSQPVTLNNPELEGIW